MTINVTSVPISPASSTETLEGLQVGSNIRESVTTADPSDPNGFAVVVSTAPSAGTPLYGYAVWLQGGTVSTNTNVTTTVTVNVTSTVGEITSSIPLIVSQSTTPWLVSTAPIALVGTSQVFGSVSTQVVSSIPFYVSQSTTPWVVSSAPIALIGTSQVFGTVSTQVVSSLPMWVSQSSAPWTVSATALPAITGAINISSASAVVSTFAANTSFVFNYPQVSTAGGYTAKTISLLAANLASTVVKASAGQLYGYYLGNMSGSMAYVKLWNASTALVVTSGALPTPLIFPIPGSSAANASFEAGIPFSTGVYFAVTAGSAAADSSSPAASSFIANLFFK